MGPPYYGLRAGSWIFLILNTEEPEVSTPAQDEWLEKMIARAEPGVRHIMFQHRMLAQVDAARVEWLANLGIEASFSGHTHGLLIARHRSGVLDFNLSRTSMGPLDRTPRSFAIVTLDASGIDYEIRRLHVDHRVAVTHPSDGQLTGGDVLEVLVQAYDTSSPVASLTASISGMGHSLVAGPLTQEGISLWSAMIDVGTLPEGLFEIVVSG